MSEITIKVESLKDFFATARDMAKRLDNEDYTPQPSSLSFTNMELLLKALTPNRWSLLQNLSSNGPSSIRALSQRVKRDYRGVHADVTALLDSGLIERNKDNEIHVPWTKITAVLSVDHIAA